MIQKFDKLLAKTFGYTREWFKSKEAYLYITDTNGDKHVRTCEPYIDSGYTDTLYVSSGKREAEWLIKYNEKPIKTDENVYIARCGIALYEVEEGKEEMDLYTDPKRRFGLSEALFTAWTTLCGVVWMISSLIYTEQAVEWVIFGFVTGVIWFFGLVILLGGLCGYIQDVEAKTLRDGFEGCDFKLKTIERWK